MFEAEMGPTKTVAVIGAGIAGVSTALYLQLDGHRVSIFDPKRPGSMTSFGNAGLIATYATLPTATPGILMKVPKMLMDPAGPLSLRWSYLPQLSPWLFSLLLNSAPNRIRRNAYVKSLLLNRAWDDFRPLIEAAKAEDLVYAGGMLRVFRTEQAFEEMKARELELMDYTKRSYELLNADEIRQMEPALEPVFPHAIYSTDSRNIRNPGRLTEVFADHFIAKGGSIIPEAVADIEQTSGGNWRIRSNGSNNSFDAVVVAAGSWSRRLAKKLRIRLLLESERGYHVMVPAPVRGLNRSVHFGEEGFMLSPMETGYRISTGVELAGIDAPPDYRRIRRAVGAAEGLVKGLKVKEESIWMGRRPSTPDTVPILGKLSGMDGLYFATGGAHIGMSLGPTFGKIIADLVSGRDPGIDLDPYRPDRW
tara:strand:+ start:6281 stop:7543 length:1263 start_codon:yes stop_codon:yes gene_type:complete